MHWYIALRITRVSKSSSSLVPSLTTKQKTSAFTCAKKIFPQIFLRQCLRLYFQKRKKNNPFFFHCLPYILWVGLVRSPCLDIFETDSVVFPSMDLQSTSTRQLVWTCCPVPTSNLNPPFTLPLCNAVSQEELQPPDKRNPTLAVGQAALGRSASSSLPPPPPPLTRDAPFDVAVVYWRFPERGWITGGP